MRPALRLVLEDHDAVVREYDANLRHGRALVPTLATAERGAPALLVVMRALDGAELELDAVISVVIEEGPMRGTALQIDLAHEDTRRRLERFVTMARDVEEASLDELPTLDFAPTEVAHAPVSEPPPPETDDEDESTETRASVDPKIVRIRKLTTSERMKLARDGQLEDRVMLERVYSKLVWEELLRNPGVSVPEVARIAAKGTAPRHLLEMIVDNQAWSRQSIVRRALLANPRIGNDSVTKLLRLTPKPELKMMTQGTSYPLSVRGLAKKLLDD